MCCALYGWHHYCSARLKAFTVTIKALMFGLMSVSSPPLSTDDGRLQMWTVLSIKPMWRWF